MSLPNKKNDTRQMPPQDLKHNPLAARLLKDAAGNELPCALAHEIGKEMDVRPREIGRMLDACRVKISKCQLGLFGYVPHKKVVKAKPPQDMRIETAVRDGLVDECLPCTTAWEIALQFDVPKMAVSNACEAMGLKIKPCQLGAF